jgi:hypothetical protein
MSGHADRDEILDGLRRFALLTSFNELAVTPSIID